MAVFEPKVYNAGRCFTNAQQWLAAQGVTSDVIYPDVEVGWHDTEIDIHKGSFALVQIGSAYEDLVGDRIRVTTRAGASAYAYVYGAADVPAEISLAFGIWSRLTYPSISTLRCRVETLR